MQIFVLAFVADLLRANRTLLQDGNYLIRKRAFSREAAGGQDPSERKELGAVGRGD
jgi:hypothetical protein